MRTFALDVHKNFSEVAVHEGGQVRRVGRFETRDLRAFAAALEPTDHVVLESTSVSWAIVDLLAEHAGKITMSNPMQTKAIAQAKVGTDKVDAKVLAKLGAADFVAEVWVPDTETRALRRRVAHRASLVRQRTALRNQVHAILARNLLALEATDLFGKKGRALLGAVELPEHESEQLASALRLHDALQGEVQRLERTLARVEAPVRAAAHDHPRCRIDHRALDPQRDRGGLPLSLGAPPGRLSRARSEGPPVGRAGGSHGSYLAPGPSPCARAARRGGAHAAVRTPGPLRAFYRRLGARRGQKIALVATARKLATVCWHMLTREEDYRFEAQALTLRKLASLQRQAARRASGSRSRARPSAARSSDACSNRRSAPTRPRWPDGEAARGLKGDATLQAVVRQTMRGRLMVPKHLLRVQFHGRRSVTVWEGIGGRFRQERDWSRQSPGGAQAPPPQSEPVRALSAPRAKRGRTSSRLP
jgi:transposase